jgi:hypothetical protein
MHSLKIASLAVLTLALTAGAAGQGFKAYPGSTKYTPPDTSETREAAKVLPAGTTSTIYTTNDPFEKVAAFYKSFAKEYQMPGRRGGVKLPTGQDLKETYLIFDGAANIVASKSWAKVQRPFIGAVDFKGGIPEYKDVRDITAIVVVEKK